MAAAVRLIAAENKSLVLDEFHTWFHATRPSLDSFFETLRLDNHPPLGFAVVAGARTVLGTSELALRTPALVFGLCELALVAILGTRLLGRRIGLAAALLLAASSLHVDFSTQARMYALHSLAATVTLVAIHALLTQERARAATVVLGLSLTVAFHTHYFGAHYVAVYGGAVVALALIDRRLRPRVRRLVAPVAVASLLCVPWAVTGFRAQMSHGLNPGGDDRGVAALAEAFVHLFFHNIRLGGPQLRLAFIGAGGLVLVLGLLGAIRLLREPGRRSLAVLLIAGAYGVPAFAWCVVQVAPRAGFTWHYVLPSAAPLALLAAAGAAGGLATALRRAAYALAVGLAATLTALNVRTPGTEDFRGAVAMVLDLYRPGDVVISVEWQPPLFPMGQPYDYYAPRLAADPPPRLAAHQYTLVDPSELSGAQRVLLVTKSLPENQHLVGLLQERYEVAERESFGFALDVRVWVPR